ncbi:hypothetical protein KC19_VG101200 [Ceratodon purpureus]|uniref:Uncharacterized protein n=1 Tax=Ceratodon purpureus TaxID=3225 RepID=A0A8T0HPF4_CERPU|nr:hypothetical protein KC19_VG101200 [Ceratodon purpureus]
MYVFASLPVVQVLVYDHAIREKWRTCRCKPEVIPSSSDTMCKCLMLLLTQRVTISLADSGDPVHLVLFDPDYHPPFMNSDEADSDGPVGSADDFIERLELYTESLTDGINGLVPTGIGLPPIILCNTARPYPVESASRGGGKRWLGPPEDHTEQTIGKKREFSTSGSPQTARACRLRHLSSMGQSPMPDSEASSSSPLEEALDSDEIDGAEDLRFPVQCSHRATLCSPLRGPM